MNYRFENRLLGRSFVRYIVPATLTMAFGQIAPLVDAACISARLGDAALSVLSVTAPVYYFINIIAVLGGVSAGVGIAQARGAGNGRTGGRILAFSLLWTAVLSAAASLLMLVFLDPLLLFLSATPENIGYCREYLHILLPGMVFYAGNVAGAYILTGDENPKLAMAGTFTGCAVNVAIDYIGLIVLGRGVGTAAFGTAFGMFCSCLVYCLHYRKGSGACRPEFIPRGQDDPAWTQVVKPAVPQAAMYFLMTVQLILTNATLKSGAGTEGLGNAVVIECLELVASILITGISEAMTPISAAYYGEGNRSGMLMVKRMGLTIGEAVMAPLVLLLLIRPQWFLLLFGIRSELMLRTLPASVRIMASAYLFRMYSKQMQNYLLATGEDRKADISVFIQYILQIPLTIVLSRWSDLNAPWIAMLLGSLGQTAYLLAFRGLRKGCLGWYPENLALITGGRAVSSTFEAWKEEASGVLSPEQAGMLAEKLLNPFADMFSGPEPEEKAPVCSFLILGEDDGAKTCILRYDSKEDFPADNGGDAGDVQSAGFNGLKRLRLKF